MKVLIEVLRDSQRHYLDVQSKILKRLDELPRGSIQKRKIGSGVYFYLTVRKGRHVVTEYLGKDEPVHLLKDIEERRLLVNRLKDVRQSLAILKHLHWEKIRGTSSVA